jgi:predicted negative regulator of RcsB-dependent stress response
MIDQFSSEQEQLETIQKWLKTHGPGIIAGIAIGLALIGGWRFWQGYEQRQAENASALYDSLVRAVRADDAPKAAGPAAVLKDDYAGSAYSALAALLLAKQAAEDNDYAKARAELEWVIAHSRLPELVDIARLRLARVLLAQEQFAEARAQLDQIKSTSLTAEVEELKGDIYLATNEPQQARTAYEAARAAAGSGAGGSLLQLKLDSLAPAAAQ